MSKRLELLLARMPYLLIVVNYHLIVIALLNHLQDVSIFICLST